MASASQDSPQSPKNMELMLSEKGELRSALQLAVSAVDYLNAHTQDSEVAPLFAMMGRYRNSIPSLDQRMRALTYFLETAGEQGPLTRQHLEIRAVAVVKIISDSLFRAEDVLLEKYVLSNPEVRAAIEQSETPAVAGAPNEPKSPLISIPVTDENREGVSIGVALDEARCRITQALYGPHFFSQLRSSLQELQVIIDPLRPLLTALTPPLRPLDPLQAEPIPGSTPLESGVRWETYTGWLHQAEDLHMLAHRHEVRARDFNRRADEIELSFPEQMMRWASLKAGQSMEQPLLNAEERSLRVKARELNIRMMRDLAEGNGVDMTTGPKRDLPDIANEISAKQPMDGMSFSVLMVALGESFLEGRQRLAVSQHAELLHSSAHSFGMNYIEGRVVVKYAEPAGALRTGTPDAVRDSTLDARFNRSHPDEIPWCLGVTLI